MDTRYCSVCIKKLTPAFFLEDASSLPSSKVFATCYICREKNRIWRNSRKRPALQEIDPNIGPPSAQRWATSTSRASFSPSVISHGLLPPVIPLLRPPPIQPPDIGPPSARRRATSTSWALFPPSVINQGPIPPYNLFYALLRLYNLRFPRSTLHSLLRPIPLYLQTNGKQ